MLKKIYLVVFGLSIVLGGVFTSSAIFGQSIPTISPFYYYAQSLGGARTLSTTTNVLIGATATTTDAKLEVDGSIASTDLAGGGVRCVEVDNAGKFTVAVGACGVAGGEANTASNQGAGEPLFIQKSSVDLEFKTIVAGTNITLSSTSDTLTINSSGSGGTGSITTSTDATANYVPYWADTNSVYGTSTISIEPDTLHTGIATTNPSTTLDIIGDVRLTGTLTGGSTFIFNGDTFTDLLGTGLTLVGGQLQTTLGTAVDLSSEVTGDLPYSSLAQGSALSVLGVTGNATADNASISAGTDHQVLRRNGTALDFGAINLAQSATVTGELGIANGGWASSTVPSDDGIRVSNGTAWLDAILQECTSAEKLQYNATTHSFSCETDATTTNSNEIPIYYNFGTDYSGSVSQLVTFLPATVGATSTIESVEGIAETDGDTTTFNIFMTTDRSIATSSMRAVFTSYQILTSTTTIQSFTANGSTTINYDEFILLDIINASTTDSGIGLRYSYD